MWFSIDCFPSTRKYIATPAEPPTGEKASDISVLFRAFVSMVVPSSCVTVVLIVRRQGRQGSWEACALGVLV